MENASKALIIAGAILLAILIISLGIVVYNQASDTLKKINIDQQEIEAFNNKFVSYQGQKVSGSQVNALRQLVVSVNGSEKNMGRNCFVTFTLNNGTLSDGSSDTDRTIVSLDGVYGEPDANFKADADAGSIQTKTYTVTLGYSEVSGLVNAVTATANS